MSETADAAPQAPAPTPTNVYVNQGPVGYGPPLPPKSVAVAYVLWFFFGIFGVHRFYLGKVGTGVLFLVTGGIALVGWIIDLFTLASQVKAINAQRAVGIG